MSYSYSTQHKQYMYGGRSSSSISSSVVVSVVGVVVVAAAVVGAVVGAVVVGAPFYFFQVHHGSADLPIQLGSSRCRDSWGG